MYKAIGKSLSWILASVLTSTAGSAAAEAPRPSGQLRVQIQDTGGGIVTAERYVAVVAIDQPWNVPVREAEVAPGDELPVWDVPAGEFRIFCSALGYLEDLPTALVPAGEVIEVSCHLREFETFTGRVVSAVDGEPIGGAELGPASHFFPPEFHYLTPLGRDHQRRKFLALTDEDGYFALNNVPGYRVLLWVRAPGYAPLYQPETILPSRSGPLPVIALSPGGALRAELAVPAGFPSSDYRVTLEPIRVERCQDTRASEGVWSRMPRPASGLVWNALPAGTFRMWLRPSGSTGTPLDLGTAEIRSGETARVAVSVPLEFSRLGKTRREASMAGETGSLLRLLLRNLPAGDRDGVALDRWRREVREQIRFELQPVAGGTLLTAAEGCLEGSTLVLRSASRVRSVAVDRLEQCALYHVEMRPAALVKGRIVVSPGHPRPKAGLLTAAGCPERDGRAPAAGAVLPFAVGPSGAWKAQVPVGCRDLTLAAADFSPETWRGLSLERASVTDLGVTRLRPGGSLRVRATRAEGGHPAPGAVVEVFAEGDLAALYGAVFGLRENSPPRPLATGLADAEGWTSFAGLHAGAVVVRASMDGASPALSDLLYILPGKEVLLEELSLGSPAGLQVVIENPPFGIAGVEELEVIAVPEAAGVWLTDAAVRVNVDMSAVAEFPSLPPGRWQLTAVALSGTGMTFEIGGSDVEILPGTFDVVSIETYESTYRGRVTRKGDPLEVRLRFDSAELGETRRPPTVETGVDGSFELFLPHPGAYTARVTAADESFEATVADVAFERPGEVVEIRLPGGAVMGWVEDADGNPLRGGGVQARRLDTDAGEPNRFFSPRMMQTAVALSDDHGRFSVENLEGGEWFLQARTTAGESSHQRVRIAKDEVRSGVVLVVDEAIRIEGRLVTADGLPVRDAVGLARLMPGSHTPFGEILRFRSDGNGIFSMDLPSQIRAPLEFQIDAPGQPTSVFRRPFSQRVELRLPDRGGRLSIELGESPSVDGMVLFEVDSGAMLELGSVGGARIVRSQEDAYRLEIPHLASGAWQFVRFDTLVQELNAVSGRGPMPASETFEIRPGDSTSIRPDRRLSELAKR